MLAAYIHIKLHFWPRFAYFLLFFAWMSLTLHIGAYGLHMIAYFCIFQPDPMIPIHLALFFFILVPIQQTLTGLQWQTAALPVQQSGSLPCQGSQLSVQAPGLGQLAAMLVLSSWSPLAPLTTLQPQHCERWGGERAWRPAGWCVHVFHIVAWVWGAQWCNSAAYENVDCTCCTWVPGLYSCWVRTRAVWALSGWVNECGCCTLFILTPKIVYILKPAPLAYWNLHPLHMTACEVLDQCAFKRNVCRQWFNSLSTTKVVCTTFQILLAIISFNPGQAVCFCTVQGILYVLYCGIIYSSFLMNVLIEFTINLKKGIW